MKRSTAILFTLALVLLLVANSADFFFRQSYYEVWDSAANSLSVIRAKHFTELYGPYSRWKFHHPGPALFYIQALGEWLFYDTLRWVRTPFPGQTLAHVTVMCCFFVASLMIFGNWMPAGRPRWWFLCGALALAVPHFTAIGRVPSYDVLEGPTAFLSTWSAHALVLPFLCLLIAGASVAAGRSDDLPVLALASGYLLQLHVAQPMFVGPVFVLAYAALLRCSHRQARLREAFRGPAGWGRRLGRYLGTAWRAHPRAHLITASILAFFALPFVLDLFRGSESNLVAILQHLRTHHTHETFERAAFYFLQFGAYTAYTTGDVEFTLYDHAGMIAFLRAHAVFYVLWTGVLLFAVWALLAGWWAGRNEEPAYAFIPEAAPGPVAACRFRAWAAVFLVLSLVLTLRWDMTQDGQMFYYNAWFTFSIYYFGVLIALAVGCATLRDPSPLAAGGRGPGTASPLPAKWERLAGTALVLTVAWFWSGSLRLVDPSPASTRAMHEGISRAEAAGRAADGGTGTASAKMLFFGYDSAPTSVAVALQLERDGLPFAVDEEWRVFVGGRHRWNDIPERMLRAGQVQTWRFVHQPGFANDPAAASLHIAMSPPVARDIHQLDDIVLHTDDTPLDPAGSGGATIRLLPGGNAGDYLFYGWSGAEPRGTWSDHPHAVFRFRPVPVADETGTVEITLVGLLPLVAPALGVPRQRLRVFFEGEQLGAELSLTRAAESLAYGVPAAAWNRRANSPTNPGGRLELEMPDAISPAALDRSGANQDMRQLGVSLREVRFRLVLASPTPVAAPGGP